MNRLAASAFVLLAPSLSPAQRPAAPAPSSPRLVVLVSVDQLAAWVYAQAAPHFAGDGGFRRLEQHGVQFLQCAYQHACSETGPGHATISTGAPAAAHGIVRNQWYSVDDKKVVYCVGHEQAALDDLPEGKDRGPDRLLAPTLGDSVKAHIPGSKVLSVSWKDRSAILMGGRAADAAVWCENSTGRFVTNSFWCEKTPPWLADFNASKVVDSYFGWVWDRFAGADAYAGLVDDRPYEFVHGNGSKQRTLPQPMTGGKEQPSSAYYTELYASPVGNELVRLCAEAGVRGMQLGEDAVPDLLCVSFSSTDLMGHYFGPDSVEARDGLLRLDRTLGRFLQFLDGAVGAGRYALFLTADHGVGPTPEWARANGVDAGRGALSTMARAAAEAALRQRYGALPSGQHYLTHVGEYSMFLSHEVLAAQAPDAPLAQVVLEASRVAAAAAAGTKGIAAAYATADLMAPGAQDDAIRTAIRAALHPDRAGDVQLVVKPYWLDGTLPASHGTPHAYDREVVAFAYGGGAPQGLRLTRPITPGFGAVWLALQLGVPRPSLAVDTVPEELLPR
ncbi:MAG: alkaline phosphatase family protein [Planctomycetes bacterium]|nr:alkaline phosphatase family protein [Planctomycetota bacterium]MCB9887416.1 alkaline phosphatase family protein [Planctomycetota bacterium]